MSINELQNHLKGLEGCMVCADVCGNVSVLAQFEGFEFWTEKDTLVFSSSTEENYLYIDISEIKSVEKNILEDIVIHMKNGNDVVIYKS